MKLKCSISLDVDNLWSYLKIHGDNSWKDYPSYLDVFIPHILKVFNDLEINVTFFIVGKDADDERNKDYLQLISLQKHSVGNHSFNHESWLNKYSLNQLKDEITSAHDSICGATDQAPIGFRGPGFSYSEDLFKVLAERNYKYDASTLPMFIGPLARQYYFWTANLSSSEKAERKELFGKFSEGFKKNKPHYIATDNNNRILEIPVTTMPFIKIPFHFSYLLYLSKYSNKLMKHYLKTAMNLCKMTGTEPSFLLHPLDVIGGDKLDQIKFFPGMDLNTNYKVETFIEVIELLKNNFETVSLNDYYSQFNQGHELH